MDSWIDTTHGSDSTCTTPEHIDFCAGKSQDEMSVS